jgi:hypothetical protein
VNGIDLALSQFNLDAVVSATDNPAWATDLIYGDHFIYGDVRANCAQLQHSGHDVEWQAEYYSAGGGQLEGPGFEPGHDCTCKAKAAASFVRQVSLRGVPMFGLDAFFLLWRRGACLDFVATNPTRPARSF